MNQFLYAHSCCYFLANTHYYWCYVNANLTYICKLKEWSLLSTVTEYNNVMKMWITLLKRYFDVTIGNIIKKRTWKHFRFWVTRLGSIFQNGSKLVFPIIIRSELADYIIQVECPCHNKRNSCRHIANESWRVLSVPVRHMNFYF